MKEGDAPTALKNLSAGMATTAARAIANARWAVREHELGAAATSREEALREALKAAKRARDAAQWRKAGGLESTDYVVIPMISFRPFRDAIDAALATTPEPPPEEIERCACVQESKNRMAHNRDDLWCTCLGYDLDEQCAGPFCALMLQAEKCRQQAAWLVSEVLSDGAEPVVTLRLVAADYEDRARSLLTPEPPPAPEPSRCPRCQQPVDEGTRHVLDGKAEKPFAVPCRVETVAPPPAAEPIQWSELRCLNPQDCNEAGYCIELAEDERAAPEAHAAPPSSRREDDTRRDCCDAALGEPHDHDCEEAILAELPRGEAPNAE